MNKTPYFVLFALVLSLVSCSNSEKKKENTLEKAKRIHDSIITVDTHDDIDVRNFVKDRNYTQDLKSQVNLPKMREGGLDVAFFIVYTGQGDLDEAGYKKAYENADSKFKAIHRLVEEYAPDEIELAYNSDDVRRIVKSGKKVAMIGVENAYPIGEDISKIEEFYNRGARYMSVAHNGHSQLGDSNTGEEDDKWEHNGLSDLGKKAIAEMNRLGIMVDLSHPSQESNKQAIELSKAPVIASHSSARALNDHSRNLYDEELKAIKDNGGVVQAVAFSYYLDSEKDSIHKQEAEKFVESIAAEKNFELLEWEDLEEMDQDSAAAYYDNYQKIVKEAEPRIEEEVNSKAPPVDVQDFVDHIDHMVKLIGIDHVGISSDFDGGGGVYNWNDASETLNVTYELVKRGYSKEGIKKLWGENLLRVLDEVQDVAKRIQEEEEV